MRNSTTAPGLSVELVQQIKAKNCIVFVGPELNLPASQQLGPPGPALLALELALKLGGRFDDYSLPWISQYYVDRFDINALQKFIVDRLDSHRYTPGAIHLLLAQLPLPQIVYLAQDNLLREAFQQCELPFNHVLEDDEALTYPGERLLIQPYGSVALAGSLKLTEDERRSVFEKRPDLAQFLRSETFKRISLFLGCDQDDPDFREFYHFLRPNVKKSLPRSHLVQPDVSRDDQKYWSERNGAVVPLDPHAFLCRLAEALEVPVPDLRPAEVQPEQAEERARRERIILDFSQQLGLGSPVESGAQLQPIANGLATLRQALRDHRKTGASMVKDSASNQDFGARLFLQEGNIEWAEGNLSRAREAFEEAIQQDPDLIDAYVSLHHLLVELGEMDTAAAMYHQIVQRDPTRAFIPSQYQLMEILGQTDVGVSYHCTDETRGREVVVTILRRALSHQTDPLKRFEQEVRALNSPRICQFLELDSFHARNYVVMEYVEAHSLRREMQDLAGAPMQLSRIFDLTTQVAEAMQVGEAQGIPHLDLRPENILLTTQGIVLSNYGFSRLAHSLRLAGGAMQRPRTEYEAPEQRANELGDQRSDVYALGTILYEMLTGRTPGLGEYRTVGEVHPQAGEALDVMIDHARAYDPAKRYQTIAEMKLELHRMSLSTDYRRFNQYTRIVLAKISSLYAALLGRKTSWITFGLILLLILLGTIGSGPGGWLAATIRAASVFLTTSLATSALGYYVVRELGRVRGLGSLIRSGRGIGASLGLVSTAFLIRTTRWGESGGLPGMLGIDFVGILIECLTLSLLMTGIAIIVMHLMGWLSENRWKHYTWGFYSGFLGVFTIVILLAIKGPPPYIIKW